MGKAWPAYRYKILDDLITLSHAIHRIFEHSVDLSRISANWAMKLNLTAWTNLVKDTDYVLNTVAKLVEEMETVEGMETGLLGKLVKNGVHGRMLQRIVGDLIIAAGDTVRYTILYYNV